MAEIAVECVLDKLVDFVDEEVQLLKGVKEEVVQITDELEHMKAFLRVADEMEERNPELDVWVKQVRDVAFDIEDILDEYRHLLTRPSGHHFRTYLINIVSSIKNLKARHHVASEIQSIKSRFVSISEGHQRFFDESTAANTNIAATTCHDRRQDALLLEEAELVGIENPKKQIISWLIQNDGGREVVSVVGMGGLGKTTLVKKAYDDEQVKLHFKYRAWVTVSQYFKLEDLLKVMLQQLYKVKRKPVPHEVNSMSNDQLRTKIKKFLQQKRYLVVLDDVWHIDDWDAVKYILPDNRSSRVMLTTRNSEVASASCMEFNGNIYPLNPLSPEESWTLFCRKTFGESPCPPDLKSQAESILARCEGLPLAIVAISGVLAMKRGIEEWDMIQRSLADQLKENARLDSMEKILLLSYNDLPCYLKSCFLYLSVFPESHLIDKMRLIRLWMAEGFVKETEGMVLEEVAEAYLDELLNRSLIQVAEITSEGRIKTCRIHDLVREIIVRKSSDQNFVTIARGQSSGLPEKVRRLSVHRTSQDVEESKSISRLRSLLMFRRVESLSESSKSISIPFDFKLLKVLDLQGAALDIFPNEIIKLFHLKYLSLRGTKVRIVPSTIGNLLNLQTLDLKHTWVTVLPAEISKLQKLRHLLVYRYEIESYAHFNAKYGFKAMAQIGCLESLQKLCAIEADYGGIDMMEELGKLNQLRRLAILKLKREYGAALCFSIQKMKKLRTLSITSSGEDEIIDLESISSPPPFLLRLYLTGRLEKLPHWISALPSLAKVSLKWTQLRADPLESLQGLPNLVHLEFLQVYEGEILQFKAGGFQKLKLLGLDKLDALKTVIVEMGAMPLLEKLILQRCKSLHRLPSGVEHLSKLKLLEFFDMPDELIMTIRPDAEDGDYWKVAHVPEINSTYWREGAWDVFSLDSSSEGESSAPTRSNELPPYWK